MIKDVGSLLIGNVSIKIINLFLFIGVVRLFDTAAIAIFALLPAISLVFYAISGLGVQSLLEKYAPSVSIKERSILIYTGVAAHLCIAIVMITSGSFFYEVMSSLMKLPSDWLKSKELICLAVLIIVIQRLTLNGVTLLGEFAAFNKINILGETLSKLLPLIAFFLDSDIRTLLVAFLTGYAISAVYGVVTFCTKLEFVKLDFSYLIGRMRKYPWLYLESIFNSLKVSSDSIIVSSLLGESSLSIYYVVKRVSEQITVLTQAILRSSIPYMSNLREVKPSGKNKGVESFLSISGRSLATLSICYSLISYPVLFVIAGEQYFEFAPLAALLSFHVPFFAYISLQLRAVLNFGSQLHRMLISMCQFAVFVFCLWVLYREIDIWAVGLSLLMGDFIAVILLSVVLADLKIDLSRTNSLFLRLFVLFAGANTLLYFNLAVSNIFAFIWLLTLLIMVVICWFSVGGDVRKPIVDKVRYFKKNRGC